MGNYSRSWFDHFPMFNYPNFYHFAWKSYFFFRLHIKMFQKQLNLLRCCVNSYFIIPHYERVFLLWLPSFSKLVFFIYGCKTGSRKKEKQRVRDSRVYMQCSTVWFILKLNQHPWILCSYFSKCAPRQEKSGIKWVYIIWRTQLQKNLNTKIIRDNGFEIIAKIYNLHFFSSQKGKNIFPSVNTYNSLIFMSHVILPSLRSNVSYWY